MSTIKYRTLSDIIEHCTVLVETRFGKWYIPKKDVMITVDGFNVGQIHPLSREGEYKVFDTRGYRVRSEERAYDVRVFQSVLVGSALHVQPEELL